MEEGKEHVHKPRATEAETQLRVNQIVAFLLSGGVSRADVIQFVKDQGWDLSDNTIDVIYLPRARAILAERADKEVSSLRSIIIGRYFDLYDIAYKKERHTEAKQILDSLSKRFGLDEISEAQAKSEEKEREFFAKLMETYAKGPSSTD